MIQRITKDLVDEFPQEIKDAIWSTTYVKKGANLQEDVYAVCKLKKSISRK